MNELEKLRKKLRIAKAQQSLEDHAIKRENEKKAIKKQLFDLKHKKKIAVFKKVKGIVIHASKNAQAMAKKASKKKKKKKSNRSPFGNFNFDYY